MRFSDVPYCDAFPDSSAGWLDKLTEDMKAPDKLGYDPPPVHLMRAVSLPDSDDTKTSRVAKESDKAQQQ